MIFAFPNISIAQHQHCLAIAIAQLSIKIRISTRPDDQPRVRQLRTEQPVQSCLSMLDSFVGFLCTFHTELYISELVTEPKQVCHFCIKWNFLKGASKSFALYGINFVSPLSELSDVPSLTFRLSLISKQLESSSKPLSSL